MFCRLKLRAQVAGLESFVHLLLEDAGRGRDGLSGLLLGFRPSEASFFLGLSGFSTFLRRVFVEVGLLLGALLLLLLVFLLLLLLFPLLFLPCGPRSGGSSSPVASEVVQLASRLLRQLLKGFQLLFILVFLGSAFPFLARALAVFFGVSACFCVFAAESLPEGLGPEAQNP